MLYKPISEEQQIYEINVLEASDADLEKISKERSLGLELWEMHKAKEYFSKLGRNPTDVELEALAQAWSEHCSYKSSKQILKKTVFNIKPQTPVIIEDAGVIEFDDKHSYVIALESHNHPSALDPYGGAATGVGGIVRDVVCMGAKPIAYMDPLFFGSLKTPMEKVPKGTKHPLYLYKGVVQGIADYGNRIGVPTVGGMVYFDDSYLSNCLVNVGCIGIVENKNITHSRVGAVGEKFILAGGRTGRDGIHGVTFASAELTEESEESSIPAVQMGFAIEKEPLIHACLQAVEEGLVSGFKDLGGGGLSCVIGEMAYDGGMGATVELDKAPLKVKKMSPWEIWVSESQERMMLSVAPENVDKVMEVFELWDVEAVVVGEVVSEKRITVKFNGITIVDMELDFYTAAYTVDRVQKRRDRGLKEPSLAEPEDYKSILLQLLSAENIASQEWIIRKYDHEVKGSTVLKPFQGNIWSPGPGDATVLKPLDDSFRGLAVTTDVNPSFTKLDPYWGGASAIEETIRNLVSVNSTPHTLADCLNFGNPQKSDRMADFVDCTNGMYYVASEFSLPFISGNVSFYNEGVTGPIAPTPTIMGVGIVEDIRKCISTDFKRNDSFIYLVGDTHDELGGSEYYKLFGERGANVPKVVPAETKRKASALRIAMDREIVLACHDISSGGFGVAVSEMLIGSNVGAVIDLEKVPGIPKRNDRMLFSETNGRWLVEVSEDNTQAFEEVMSGLNCHKVGKTTKEKDFVFGRGKVFMSGRVDELRDAWRNAIPKLVEGD